MNNLHQLDQSIHKRTIFYNTNYIAKVCNDVGGSSAAVVEQNILPKRATPPLPYRSGMTALL